LLDLDVSTAIKSQDNERDAAAGVYGLFVSLKFVFFNLFFFSVEIIFFSYTKSGETMFRLIFLAKRTSLSFLSS